MGEGTLASLILTVTVTLTVTLTVALTLTIALTLIVRSITLCDSDVMLDRALVPMVASGPCRQRQ